MNTKILFFTWSVFIAFSSCTDNTSHLCPYPISLETGNGSFTLSASTEISAVGEGRAVGELLSRELGISMSDKTEKDKKSGILLRKPDSGWNMGPEGYWLMVKPGYIEITASSDAGFFYGAQTLMQLAPLEIYTGDAVSRGSLKIPCIEIKDKPRFEWRSVMLDLSRHYFGPETIRKLIDRMAVMKLNRLHLHLTDNPGWRIEIKEYPELALEGGRGSYSNPDTPVKYMTETEARNLTAYAKERFITIVPEIDLPGHSAAIGRVYPEFDGGDSTLNVTNEDALKMIDVILERLGDIFDTPYVHFGSDEVRRHHWDERPDMKEKMEQLGLKDQTELEMWFDRRTAKQILNMGFRPVAWDEASDFDVDPETIVQWWRCQQPDKLEAAIYKGHQVIISPADHSYFDYPYVIGEGGAGWEGLRNGGNSTELVYNWKPIPSSFGKEMIDQILGLECCIWTEFISEEKHLEYMIFPRIAAFAEKCWTAPEKNDWVRFQQALEYQYKYYEHQGVNYRIPGLTKEERKEQQPEAFTPPIHDGFQE